MSSMQDLYEKSLEWFVANFASGNHASLQILTSDSNGQLGMHRIHANGDAEMFESARTAVVNASANMFVGFGEGNLPTKNGLVPILIMFTNPQPTRSCKWRCSLTQRMLMAPSRSNRFTRWNRSMNRG